MVVRRVAVDTETGGKEKQKDFYADLDAAKRGRRLGCGSCVSLFALFLFVIVLGILGVIATTGYVRVPLVSDMVYKQDPEPRKAVDPTYTGGVAGLIQTKAATLGASGGTVTLTEGELTGALREPNAKGELLLKQGQVSIAPDGMEVYGQVTELGNVRPVILRAYLVPASNLPGQIELQELKVGHLTVPLQYARQAIQFFLGIDLGTTASLTPYGIQSVALGQGTATLQLSSAGFTRDGLASSLDTGLLSPADLTPTVLNPTEVPAATE